MVFTTCQFFGMLSTNLLPSTKNSPVSLRPFVEWRDFAFFTRWLFGLSIVFIRMRITFYSFLLCHLERSERSFDSLRITEWVEL